MEAYFVLAFEYLEQSMVLLRNKLFCCALLISACASTEGTVSTIKETAVEKNGAWGIATSHDRSKNFFWLEDIGQTGINQVRGYHVARASESLADVLSYDMEPSGFLSLIHI